MNFDRVMKLKRLIYLVYSKGRSILWRLLGGRRVKAMGLSLNLHPHTVWPGRRGMRLPHGVCRSTIVSFVDFVQAHAVCNAIESMTEPVIIDVGAHHGEYALLLGGILKAKNAGIVIAIEPDPENTVILKNNICRNALQGIVHVMECAVSDSSGKMNFVSNGIEGHLLPAGKAKDKNNHKIKVETLHNIVEHYNLSKVDILLVDVEGAELPVLQGFPWGVINPSMIFCELHPYNWPLFGYTGNDMSNFLKQHNYRCLDMYLHEHSSFDNHHYTGPCLFLQR